MTSQHCDHECVCPDYQALSGDSEEELEPCTISCMQRSKPEEEPTREELIEFVRFTQKFWKGGQEIMRGHDLCIDDLNDDMQKLAFTFYSNLCEIDSRARHLFQEAYGEDNYHDERLPAGVTYTPEHDAVIRNTTLDEMIKLSMMIEENETELWERAGRPKNDGYVNGSHSGYGHALRDMRKWIDQIKRANGGLEI